jgi:hypothetical protein
MPVTACDLLYDRVLPFYEQQQGAPVLVPVPSEATPFEIFGTRSRERRDRKGLQRA